MDGDWPRDKKSLLQGERKHHDLLREGAKSPEEGHSRLFSCPVHSLRHIHMPPGVCRDQVPEVVRAPCPFPKIRGLEMGRHWSQISLLTHSPLEGLSRSCFSYPIVIHPCLGSRVDPVDMASLSRCPVGELLRIWPFV